MAKKPRNIIIGFWNHDPSFWGKRFRYLVLSPKQHSRRVEQWGKTAQVYLSNDEGSLWGIRIRKPIRIYENNQETRLFVNVSMAENIREDKRNIGNFERRGYKFYLPQYKSSNNSEESTFEDGSEVHQSRR